MDWRRARVLGNARDAPLHDLWHGVAYRALRWFSDRGQLDQVPLCRECGENRFSIDPDAVRVLLDQPQAGDGPDDGARDMEVVAMLERFQAERSDVIQLGLLRGRGGSA
jgi:hypothetical protein